MPKVIHLVERTTWSELDIPRRLTDREGNPKPGVRVRNKKFGDTRTVISSTDKTISIRTATGSTDLWAGDDFALGDWVFV